MQSLGAEGCIKKRAELVDENEVRIYTKGAPDIVQDLTTHALSEDG